MFFPWEVKNRPAFSWLCNSTASSDTTNSYALPPKQYKTNALTYKPYINLSEVDTKLKNLEWRCTERCVRGYFERWGQALALQLSFKSTFFLEKCHVLLSIHPLRCRRIWSYEYLKEKSKNDVKLSSVPAAKIDDKNASCDNNRGVALKSPERFLPSMLSCCHMNT